MIQTDEWLLPSQISFGINVSSNEMSLAMSRMYLLPHRENLSKCFLFVLRIYRRFSGTVMLAGMNVQAARSMILCDAAALNDIYYCNRNALFDRMRGRNRLILPRLLSVSDNSITSNDLNRVKYVNTLNKITANVAFERIICYNYAAKEKNHAA